MESGVIIQKAEEKKELKEISTKVPEKAEAGKINNNSENDFYSASFILKIYSKDYGMITSFDFTVRRIKSGETKPFDEIITGVRPVDIGRYEITFKSAY